MIGVATEAYSVPLPFDKEDWHTDFEEEEGGGEQEREEEEGR